MSAGTVRVLYPLELIDTATAENVLERLELLDELLMSPEVPDDIRADLEMRLGDLVRRFPDQLQSGASDQD